jgi:hypothetical protein
MDTKNWVKRKKRERERIIIRRCGNYYKSPDCESVTQWEDQSHGENDTCGNSLGASSMDDIADSQ